MDNIKWLNALGIMSGASLDGAEFSLVKTDGIDVYAVYKSQKFLYPEELKQSIINAANNLNEENSKNADEQFTDFIIKSFDDFISICDEKIDIIGFEGHTICFEPDKHCIVQIGNAQQLANHSKIKTVYHFHHNDIALGGQGSPISTAYFASLASGLERPLAFLNIGGTTMLIFIGDLGNAMAFDCGVGNNIINQFMHKHACMDMDYDGKYAISGRVDEKVVQSLLKIKYLHKNPPKASSLNTIDDKIEHMEGLSIADGAATATDFAAEAICFQMRKFLPEMPKKVLICGGGAHNPTLKRFLRQKLPECVVETADKSGFDMATMEAQARGFLAARRLYNMPISFPGVTGVIYPAIGGDLVYPDETSK